VKTHGMKGTPEYNSWRAMKWRCKVGRGAYSGVTVCSRWQASFELFLWDMGRKPSPLHTIERKRNELGYEPTNCVWATPREQRLNTSRVHLVAFRGVTQTVSEWAVELGLAYTTLRARLRRGWTVEDAFSIVPGPIGARARRG
jgi:hypothetical protein